MEYPTAWDSQQQQKNKRDMEEKKEGEEERGNIKARMKSMGRTKHEDWQKVSAVERVTDDL